MNLTLQQKFSLLILIFMLIPLILVGSLSFRRTSETLTEMICESNLNTLNQIGTNIDMTFQDIHGVSLYLPFNDDMRDFYNQEEGEWNYKSTIYNPLTTLFFQKSYFESVYLESFTGHTLDSSGASNTITEEQYTRADEQRGRHFWFKSSIRYPFMDALEVFSFMRVINDIYKMIPLGYLKVNISAEYIREMMIQAQVGAESTCILLSRDGDVLLYEGGLLTHDKRDILEQFNKDPALKNRRNGYSNGYRSEKSYLVTWYRLHDADWVLVNIIPRRDILKDNDAIRQYFALTALFCFLVFGFLGAFLVSTALKPIHTMSTLMKNIHDEDFDVQIDVRGQDEIASLGRSFNRMSARLKVLVEKEYQARIRQQSAELQALQEQINPHFLYNTLDTICWMNRMNKDFETAKIVEALSNMFRLSLNSGNEITTVKQEAEHLRSYFIIQSKRYEKVIRFHLDVDESLYDCSTPKLILQPLVENSIKHGIEPTGEPGEVLVSVKSEEDHLVYRIEDNGAGFNPDTMYEFINGSLPVDGNRGFAVKNIHDRIRLIYGEPFGLSFFRNGERGALVLVTLPLETQKEKGVRHNV